MFQKNLYWISDRQPHKNATKYRFFSVFCKKFQLIEVFLEFKE